MATTIRFDWAIKRLLRNKANFGILEGFLSELLHTDIKIKSLLEGEGNQQTAANKLNRVDLIAEDSSGEIILIEVQSDYTNDYLLRILFGTAKLIVDHMDKGYQYSQIKKVISVNILYFDLGHGQDYIYHGTTQFVGMNKHDVLGLSQREKIVFKAEEIANVYPEFYIIKVNQFDEIAKNTLDEWIRFLKNEEVNDNTHAKGLLEAKEKMNVLKLSKQEMIAYENDLDAWRDYASSMSTSYLDGVLKGQAKGIEEGIEKGIQKGVEIGKLQGEENKERYAEEKVIAEKLAIARSLLASGMAIGAVASITGLQANQIETIK
jgi:predicted transposase/invertase (TIGR01784 family)